MAVEVLSVQLNNLLNTAIVDPATGLMSWQWRQFFIGLAGPTSKTIPLAKITGGGTDGYISFNEYGVLTEYVDPT